MKKCPLLNKCRKVSGIDCTDRDFMECFYFQMQILEKMSREKLVRYTLNSTSLPTVSRWIWHPYLWKKELRHKYLDYLRSHGYLEEEVD